MTSDNVATVRAEVLGWLLRELEELTGLTRDAIDTDTPLHELGVGSRDAVSIANALEREFAINLPPTLAWEQPTLRQLANYVATRSDDAARPPEPVTSSVLHEPVAIVGMSCRLPGAESVRALWAGLHGGLDAVSEVGRQHWLERGMREEQLRACADARFFGGFLRQVDQFEPGAFQISDDEAARMDPQQRLLLEVVAEAMQDAGVAPRELAGSRTGVFVGAASFDYARMQLELLAQIDARTASGSALSIIANRISYVFDLRGPSMVVDTACSSSLVALHLALRSLRAGDCERAIVAGVNLILSPAVELNFRKAGAMAADGRCKFMDARADGYVRSEGAGALILERLSDAVEHGRRSYACVRGSAVNQDGRSNGLMAPNPQAQIEVLRAACRDAGVRSEDVGYVEAHGTGTVLGDPIEVRALAQVYRPDPAAGEPCLLGSIKTNLGHLEAAAGIAGLIKAALILQHSRIPPSLHLRSPNPHVVLEELGLRVCTEATPLPTRAETAVGVSSFGFGGTNAHVLLSRAQPVDPTPELSDGHAWQRQRFWFQPVPRRANVTLEPYHHGELAALPSCAVYDFELELTATGALRQLPWASVLDAALEHVRVDASEPALCDVLFADDISADARQPLACQLYVDSEDQGFELFVDRRSGQGWTLLARGSVTVAHPLERVELAALRAAGAQVRELPPTSNACHGELLASVLDSSQQLVGASTTRRVAHYQAGCGGAPRSLVAEPERLMLLDERGHVLRLARGVELAELSPELLSRAHAAAADASSYELRWITRSGELRPGALQGQRWLLLGAIGSFERRLIQEFEAHGAELRAIHDWAVLSPVERTRQLLEARCAGVLLMTADEEIGEPEVPRHARDTFMEQLATLRALAHASVDAKLWIVVRAQARATVLAQSVTAGLGRVAALELRAGFAGVIELAPDVREAMAAEQVSYALGEGQGEDRWRVARGGPQVPRLTPLAQRSSQPAPALRADGAYLISGGTGGAGLALARWCVERGARRLLLTGRRPSAPELEQPLAELRALGAEVRVLQLDAGDYDATLRAVRELSSDGVIVRGIFHLAGVAGEAELERVDAEGVRSVFSPKLDGAWNLHRVARALTLPLEQFVLFGSISSVWGAARLGVYAAANSFLGSLAAHRHALGLPATCIHWGWLAEGRLVAAAHGALLSGIGLRALPSALVHAALDRALTEQRAESVVAAVDWSQFVPAFEAQGRQHLFDDLSVTGATQDGAGASWLPVLAQLPAASRLAALVELMRTEVASLLRREAGAIDTRLGLFDMGMDSLLASGLRARVERALAISLPPTAVFDQVTIERLCRFALQLAGPMPEGRYT
jgi:3-oxoacyl-(acyl-carrier-protein) synthase/acyl carrier protein/NAD(P)-dependent dehydrogenase (short-subunit alcohol dehydrogenase family)